MSTLGQELKREREMRGVPLQEIARQTKININYLQALEQDRLDLLPGEFFIKGTIRAYARCVGLEENQVLNLYLRTGRSPSQPASTGGTRKGMKMTPGRWKKLALTVLPLLLLAAVLVYFHPWAPGQRKTTSRSGPAVPAERAQNRPQTPPQPAATAPAVQTREAEGLVLELAFQDVVWIRVQADQGIAEEALLRPGERKSIAAARSIILRLGRPDRVDMIINGRRAKPFPPSAEAQTYEITISNYRTFLAE